MDKVNISKILGGLCVLVLLVLIIPKYNYLENVSGESELLFFGIGILYFLFGVLLELDKLLGVLTSRKLRFNWSILIPTVILTLLVFIPTTNWIKWFGTGSHFPYNPFIYSELRAILTVVCGIIFIRSFERD
ncbi:hypothetical protein [Saliterribacillus persicus]|uniref:Uncharacterized protein n=1 Tax=Saliterribacillus persicus TaxID=930114 RepID=A0A368Y986_9BACI|nr:hypothetical protein [Saliterribacillus persicus]RCW76813.1 hypothetical protein DFR57_10288 [Saliterribacillus persicus]